MLVVRPASDLNTGAELSSSAPPSEGLHCLGPLKVKATSGGKVLGILQPYPGPAPACVSAHWFKVSYRTRFCFHCDASIYIKVHC